VVVAHALAQHFDQRRLAGAHGAADTDAERGGGVHETWKEPDGSVGCGVCWRNIAR
jgi:hypothetical protein